MEVGQEYLKLIEEKETVAPETTNVETTETTETIETAEEISAAGEAEEVVDTNQEIIPAAAEEVEDEFNTEFQEKVVKFMTAKTGRQITTVEDLLKEPEVVEKIVEKNPYENIDSTVKGFLTFHTETGRSYEDYQKMNQDISAISDLELARERVLSITGLDLSKEDIDAYLEKTLNIDLSDVTELDTTDKIALTAFTKEFRSEKVKDQEKYKIPLEQKQPANEGPEMVTLEDGQIMPKEVYDSLVSKHTKYLEDIGKAKDEIVAATFQIEYEDKDGSKKTMDLEADYSKEDVHSMVSAAENVNAYIEKLFRTEKGFDHKGLMEALHRANPKNWEKITSNLVNKALAQRTEELLKEVDNVNLGEQNDLSKGSKNQRTVPVGSQSGYGVKYDFENT